MLAGNQQSVIVGNRFGIKFGYGAESRIGRAVRDCIITPSRRKRTEAPRVCVKVLREFMNSMVAKVTDAERSMRSKSLLQLQTPSLVLGLVGVFFRNDQRRRKEVRNILVNLGQRFACVKSIHKCLVGIPGNVEKAVLLPKRQNISGDCKGIQERRIVTETGRNAID